ncbi:Spy/CpxP family protein refolding chaperone [Aquibium sp. LZ166]|uniref:Spy/CpxP family protein refolding chaperone n=1 Tax=Aquibium pacificus TaxID=3153579 RepID=A0ABV3SLU8_9HYPH
MSVSSLKKAFMAGALLMMVAGPVAADDDDDWSGSGPRWGMGHMMGSRGGPMMGYGWGGPDTMLDRIDGRLAFMRTELKITDEQTPAWEAFASVVRDTAETHNTLMRSTMEEVWSGDFQKKPLPERLSIQETHLEARLEQVRQVKEKADALYAVLDDEQKNAADDVVLPMMGMGHGRGFGRGMMPFRE